VPDSNASKRKVELVVKPKGSELELVNTILRRFNETENSEFWRNAMDPARQTQPLYVLAYDQSGAVVGGLRGETDLSWLKVYIMAVEASCRCQGLGTQILKVAETEAVRRGCKYAFLDTMQYQAPDFYKRLGYKVVGSIPDWDSHGHAKYFMTKKLNTRSAVE